MKSFKLSALLLIITAFFSLTEQARSVTVYDLITAGCTSSFDFRADNLDWEAYKFNATGINQITSVTVRIKKPSSGAGGTYYVELWSSAGTVPSAFVASVGSGSVSDLGTDYTDINFTPTISVTSGNDYWIVFKTSTSDGIDIRVRWGGGSSCGTGWSDGDRAEYIVGVWSSSTTDRFMAKIDGVAGPSIPTVTSSAATNRGTTTATGNGDITNTGGENCTDRGICWKLYSDVGDPTTADTKNNESGTFGTGAFSRSITGLSAGTRYKYRAYATNSAGTGYGALIDFYTLANEPTIPSRIKIRSVTTTTAFLKWKRGNGEQCVVVVKAENNFTQFTMIDGWGTPYSNNCIVQAPMDPYEEGAIVYVGTGNTCTVECLNAGTTYYVYVAEFNGADATINFLTGAGAYIRRFTTATQ